MTRAGSISLSLIVALCVGSAAVGGAGGWYVTAKRAEQRLSEAQSRTESLSAELGECRARETQEAIANAAQGTTDALTVALGPDLAEVHARAELVRAIPRAQVIAELLPVASPQLLAALERMQACEALQATGETDRVGCGSSGPVVEAWSAAVEVLAACPEPDPPALELAPPTVAPRVE